MPAIPIHRRQLSTHRFLKITYYPWIVVLFLIGACKAPLPLETNPDQIHPEDLLIVDCLLPPQVRQLGTQLTYLSPRRPIRTTAAACALRGGEYVAYSQADFSSALAVWKPLAERGDPEAQTYVGEIYENGLGTEESYKLAAQWYERAVEQNFDRAKINLGYLYESGLGVERNLVKALNLYRQASGFTESNLEFVSSIEQDNNEALKRKSELLEQQANLLEHDMAISYNKIKQQQLTIEQKNQAIISLRRQVENHKSQLDSIVPTPEKDMVLEKNNVTLPNTEESKQRSSDLKRLDNSVKQKELEIERHRSALAELQAQLAKTSKNLENIVSSRTDTIDAYGPGIDVIDPPVFLKNGAPTLKPNARNMLDLVGKVRPADSIFALRINGSNQAFNRHGLFHYVSTDIQTKSIEITVVDNDGRVSKLPLNLDSPDTDTVKTQRSSKTNKERSNTLTATDTAIDFGNYHALILSNDQYQHHPDLIENTTDTLALENVLRDTYGFSTQTLMNASGQQTLAAFDRLRTTLGEDDNLVIYFSGLGQIDDTGNCYWLGVDASLHKNQAWLENQSLIRLIDSMLAKHVLVITDACFTGTLSRTSIARRLPAQAPEINWEWLQAISRSRVRTVLGSGKAKPTVTGQLASTGPTFTHALVDVFTKNKNILEAYSLFLEVQEQLSSIEDRKQNYALPFYSPIKHTGHEAGEFLFTPQPFHDPSRQIQNPSRLE